jgi:hypothetical protein
LFDSAHGDSASADNRDAFDADRFDDNGDFASDIGNDSWDV